MLGLFQAVRFCEDGNAYVNSDTVVDYANREFKNVMGNKVPVPLLDSRRGTICGVQVNLHNYIRDDRLKKDITDKLEKIKINVKYQLPRKPELEQREYEDNQKSVFTFCL